MSLNSTHFPSVPETTATAIVTPWLDIIRRQECGIISFFPRGGAYRRIEQLMGWSQLRKKYFGKTYKKYKLVDYCAFGLAEISVSELAYSLVEGLGLSHTDTILSPQAFIASLTPLLNQSKSISFLIYDCDEWFLQSRTDLMVFLSKVSQLEPRIQFLLFCEIDPASPTMLTLNLGTTTLTQNILTVPLYSRSDIDYFIHQLELFWQVSIPQSVIDEIIDQIGCHIWLIKEAVRIYLHAGALPQSFADEPTMRFKLEAIWQQIDAPEKQTLAKLVRCEHVSKFDNPSSIYHLKAIGFISSSKDEEFRLTLPVFDQFIQQKVLQSNFALTADQDITLNEKVITYRFGHLERKAFIYLLQHSGNVVSRYDLGNVIWPGTAYSDWALDRLMSRLREKIYQFGVNPERLKTIKKVGWIWQQ